MLRLQVHCSKVSKRCVSVITGFPGCPLSPRLPSCPVLPCRKTDRHQNKSHDFNGSSRTDALPTCSPSTPSKPSSPSSPCNNPTQLKCCSLHSNHHLPMAESLTLFPRRPLDPCQPTSATGQYQHHSIICINNERATQSPTFRPRSPEQPWTPWGPLGPGRPRSPCRVSSGS